MLDLSNTVVYDIETFLNVFTLHMEALHSDASSTWEISTFRDDRRELIDWFNWLYRTQTPMIGFFSLQFDYPVIHYIYTNPQATIDQIYAKAQELLGRGDRFGGMIWERDRFAPQIDLAKIHHFDNKAKTTSLKALQVNMRAETVVDMPVEPGTVLGHNEVNGLLIPYNRHDVTETKRFAHFSTKAIEFRLSLVDQFGVDVMNFNDTKIGAKILEQKIGEDICYDRSSGRKQPRQTVRNRIALADIIFNYVSFTNPEFARVLDWMKQQVLTPDDLEDPDAPIKTKGVFTGVKANVGGIDFHFGTGGIHGSVSAQRIIATDEWLIRDIDVASLYPSIAIVNKLAPAHLGEAFTREYAEIPKERKKWQQLKGKKCVEANSLKLAANGTYGKSNDKYSVFYDPQLTMTITINGQLLICMLAEWLLTVPTVQLIQANTDGITYRIHRDYLEQVKAIETRWEQFTLLTLESVHYKRMWLRDVNNYIAEDMDGKLKQKGAYWHPDPFDYANSISEQQPPAWHKDLGNCVSIRAAVAAMVHGVDPDAFIRAHSDPFDFMLRIKVDRASKLLLGGSPVQPTTRYYVARDGAPMVKISPPAGPLGDYKRRNGLTDAEFNRIAASIPAGQWDERIHTKNKSRYEQRETAIEAGWKVAECNDARSFRFDNVEYAWYVNEARKLII
ncbi:hypothetical protein EOA32_01000 [Mesorhizobium sp. M1A.F.Ca.ET.072.01.1.1]|uniref:hypothetical protein n=1 Tax=Mesorhizobium sp. M1A.F.Ca.ET.072.01.1.1 TaxID=2496753 RepID=UPI000FD1A146|nr:hypothetical protein [Mesorhizobium sp. M1A.F.Ca.ET.072.01.1.1]RUW55627.1 hypothetical protein EOA32_01000 [Mesorhizobium sp. M1A.F.Ca.ET.072.01.1.1]